MIRMPEDMSTTPLGPVRRNNSAGSNDSEKALKEESLELILQSGKLDKKYECPVCMKILRYPVQFEECNHRVCSSCLPELLR